MIFQITLYDDLDITVICCVPDTVVNGSQSKTYVIYIKIPVTGIFPVNDLHRSSLFAVTAPVYDEEISLREDKLIEYRDGSFII